MTIGAATENKGMTVFDESRFRRFWNTTADLALRSVCPGCGTPGWSICLICKRQLPGSLHEVARPLWDQMPPVVAAGWYEKPLARLVIVHKDEGAWQLSRVLGELLATAVSGCLSDRQEPFALVPVPSDRQAIARRGYDHGRALARAAARRLGAKEIPLLRRIHQAKDQVGRNRLARIASQPHTMAAASTTGVPIVVTDDIVTSGATLREAVRALRLSGHCVFGAAVICDTRASRHEILPRAVV